MGAGRLTRPWVLAAAAAWFVAAIVVLALVLGDDAPGPRPARLAAVEARTVIKPDAHLFGDRVSAELDVVVDAARVDADSVRVVAAFPPYRILGGGLRERTESDGTVALRYGYTLLCLSSECLAGEGKKRFSFEPAEVRYRAANGRIRTVPARWPNVSVTSRLPPEDERPFTPEWRPANLELPTVDYRVEPRMMVAALYGGAAIVAIAGVVLLLYAARPGLAARRGRRDDLAGLGALERALALLRRSRSERDRRKALDRLARELRVVGDEELAGSARRLAWSEPQPVEEDADELAGEVERTIGAAR